MVLLKLYTDSHSRPKIVHVIHFPFIIGRAIESHLIIDFPCISAKHCYLDINPQGDLFIQDCHSLNGLYTQGDKISFDLIDSNKIYYIGEMKLEVYINQHNYDKTREIHIPLEVFHGEGNWHKILVWPIFSYLFIIIPETIKIYFTDPLIEGEWAAFFGQMFLIMLGSTLFSALLAFISKIHLKKYQFLRFIKTTNIGIGIIDCVSIVLPFILFSIEGQKIQSYLRLLLSILFLFLFFYSNLRKIYHKLENKKFFYHSLGTLFIGIICKFCLDFYDNQGNNTNFLSPLARPWKNYTKQAYPERKLWIKMGESVEFIKNNRIKKIQEVKKRT